MELVKCRCGGQIFERVAGQDTTMEWAHLDAFNRSDTTMCPDGGTARPAQTPR